MHKRKIRLREFFSDSPRGSDGQAVVEFAIAFPLQLFITLAVAQLILIYISTLMVNYAAYRACRAEIVGGDPKVVVGVVLAPLTSRRSNGFTELASGVEKVNIPGWGDIRNSDMAQAKTNVYVTSESDDHNVTLVVEYNQELIFPVVDSLFAMFLNKTPDSDYDPAQQTFGVIDENKNDPTERVHRLGGPFIREFGGTRYIVITRECTMYRQILPEEDEEE
ncbi:MAG: pilus assembly protein [Planctomycetes bacterium]|nr:pilus assembly protein [Planctomycetota bacterium]